MTTLSTSNFLITCFLIIFWTAPAFTSANEATLTTDAVVPNIQSKNETLKEAPLEFDKEYFKRFVTDFKSIITAPARWDASDRVTASLVVGVSAGLYAYDDKLRKWALDHKTTTMNNIGDDVTLVGFGALTIPVVGGMYLYGYLTDDGKMRKTSLLSVESFILTGVFVQTLKYATGRHRPDTDDPPHTWDGPRLHNSGSNRSFPSGHASSAFSIAAVIASEYDNIIVQTLAYGVATITALNRVTHNAHWSSDVFVGSAIGYFTGKAVVASHRGYGESRLSLVPMTNGRDMMIGIMYGF